jgi:prepilin signal peptidase PulO-like enzyme (type II secretory pathway)
MVQLIWWIQQVILSYYDIKIREVPLILLLMNGLIAIVQSFITSVFYVTETVITSAMLLSFSWIMKHWLKKEAIGMGDIILLMTFALFQGAMNTYLAMTIGSLLAFMWTLLYPKRTIIPFVPFLEIGLGVSMLWPFS